LAAVWTVVPVLLAIHEYGAFSEVVPVNVPVVTAVPPQPGYVVAFTSNPIWMVLLTVGMVLPL
jgi:hypothetical protein